MPSGRGDKPTVASFDVFDTVLTRQVGAPEAVIAELARELMGSDGQGVSPASFIAERRFQERRLNALLLRHADLREIYDCVAAALSLGDGVAQRWAAAEEAVEMRLSVAVPGAARHLQEARERGAQVVFVSDTPHSEAFIGELLGAQHLLGPTDRVFTSAERRVSKSRGGLFQLVASELGGDLAFTHVGDHEDSDLAAPRVEGWSSGLLRAGRLTKYEHTLESHAQQTDAFTSWLAGASRIARLEAQERGVPADLASVSSGAMAPMLVGFALWVVRQARLRGVRRLYYVARDGRVMLDAARPLVERLAPDIELRYLHGSRQPWILGAGALSEDVLRRWIDTKSEHSARTALRRLDLTPEQVHRVRPFRFTEPPSCDTILTVAERTELAAALQVEPLRSLVRESAHRQAASTMAYFEQEGLCDGVPSALVDAGWAGRTAQAFDFLLDEAGGARVPHLFMGITGDADDARNRQGVELVPWLFDEQAFPASLAGLRGPNVLVEMFCADASGRTLGYRDDAGVLVPVMDVERNAPVIEWGLPVLQDIAVRVAQLVAEQVPEVPEGIDTARFVRDVLRDFWVTPSRAEVTAWGSFPWEEEVAHPFVPIAQRITTFSVLERLSRGETRLRRQNGWRAGSAMVSTQPWRGLLEWRAWLDDHGSRARNVPRRLRLTVHKRLPVQQLRARRRRG